MGKCANFELRCIPPHLHAVDRQPGILNSLAQRFTVTGEVLGIVEIQMR